MLRSVYFTTLLKSVIKHTFQKYRPKQSFIAVFEPQNTSELANTSVPCSGGTVPPFSQSFQYSLPGHHAPEQLGKVRLGHDIFISIFLLLLKKIS